MKLIDLFEKEKFPHSRVDVRDPESVIAWCRENASEYMSNPTPIFRGDGFANAAIYHTDQINRISKNTRNYYTQWMDNHPDWDAYPKRSKSLICTTDEEVAYGYHQNVMRVIPSNSCKIGVVPADDLWYAFKPMRDFFKNGGLTGSRTASMDNITNVLDRAFSWTRSDDEQQDFVDHEYGHGESPLEQSWPMLQSQMKEVTTDLIRDRISANTHLPSSTLRAYTLLARKMEREGFDNLYDALNVLMEPKLNHFQVVSPSSVPDGNHELWIGGGDCLLIPAKSYLIDELKDAKLLQR